MDGEPGTVNGGEEQDLPHGWLGRHTLQPQETATEAKQHGAAQRLGLASRLQQGTVLQDSLKQINTKIQLMMKGTNIKINCPAMWFSKKIMEMKRKKTAEEPKKQNAGAKKRVALEEEDRVKMDRWMTEPVHKVRTMFPKQHHLSIHHVIHLQCHRFTLSSIDLHGPCHLLTMPSIDHAIHSHCHPFTIPFVHYVIQSPYNP